MKNHIYLHSLLALPEMFRNYILYNKPLSLIDYGCGYGFWFYVLEQNKLLPKTSIGIEINRELCETAVQHINEARFVNGDMTQISFSHDQFQLAICNHAIEHTENDTAVIRNIYKSLRNNGILYISSIAKKPNAGNFYKCKKTYKGITDLIKLLTDNNFKILQAKENQYWCPCWKISRGKFKIPIPGWKHIETLAVKI